jgi:uncharacterized protein YodC (DUF2158 family)
MSDFKRGDEVQHISGGPKMGVENPDNVNDQGIVCSWWDEKAKKFQKDTFPPEVLKPYKPPAYF